MNAPGDRLNLLIVEDDERTMEELLRILPKHTNLNILSAPAPGRAIEAADSAPIHLVLLDMKLPEMSGLELLPVLKEKHPDLLATIMTGFGEASTPMTAKEKGAVDFIEKPIDLSYLLATLRFQEREARIRLGLRNTAELLQKFFSLTKDGISITDAGGEALISNTLGRELRDQAPALKDGDRVRREKNEYELSISTSGDKSLYHFKEVTKAVEKSKAESRVEMARLLAHELHNCLTPLKLWLQELESLDDDDPGFAELSKKAATEGIRQMDRLSRLTRRFKELSADKPVRLSRLNILSQVTSLADSLKAMLDEKSLKLEINIPKDLDAEASEMELYHILFNLVSNAVDAQGSKGGVIKITAEITDRVLISVIDDGGGLPEEVEKAPFTPYLTTKEGGTGLGLLLSRELARRMGGDLKLVNHEGKGVEAVLELKA
ncbi:MAG TPA: hybrid sensor histidine kinase/response regulator [Acidobacteriota bacterium]|nr:hybrid sensor histidine kinase/response regulator [Acidobacteriota bacterium]HQO19117.1 hybrid sensor histidine kinase/response regulator [Acidobacteriota bacterium]HQQ46599.1 hybrid sensor histidine kinase/response regulator [Acidobacteriota bacterium]